MRRVALEKKGDVRVGGAAGGHGGERGAQTLGKGKTDEGGRGVEGGAVAFAREMVEEALRAFGSGGAGARDKLAPKDRQDAVGAETGREQQPVTRAGRDRGAEVVHRSDPGAGERGRAPGFGRDNGVAGVNRGDGLAIEDGGGEEERGEADEAVGAAEANDPVLFREVALELRKRHALEVEREEREEFGAVARRERGNGGEFGGTGRRHRRETSGQSGAEPSERAGGGSSGHVTR